MGRYPSETSLTVNAVGEMVRRTDAADRVAATGPTRLERGSPPDGYPVRRADAARLAFKFEAPAYEHGERGRCFELSQAAVGTLSMRDPAGAAYVACPRVDGPGELDVALDACRFVAVHALRTDTSRLFVPEAAGEGVTAKVRDADDARGFDRDPANYYEVPESAVLTWPQVAASIDRGASESGVTESGVSERGVSGAIVRADGAPTEAYGALLERLGDFADLYPRPDRPSAAPAPRSSLDDAAADRLVTHAVSTYERTYEDAAIGPDPTAERAALESVVDRMRGTRDAGLYRVRRSCELVVEWGPTTEPPLVLGATDGGDGDADSPLRAERSGPSAGGDDVETTTLSEYL